MVKKVIAPKTINNINFHNVDKSTLDQDSICNICLFKNKSCICQSFWKTFEEDMNKIPELKNIKPSKLSISTMTFGFSLKDTSINLQKIADSFQKTLFTRFIKFKDGSKKSKNNDDLNFRFYNQCTITSFIPSQYDLEKVNKVSIKIFHNGSFNFTGVKTLKELIYVTRNIIKYLYDIPGVINKIENIKHEKIKIEKMRIRMINTNFGINQKIRLKALNDSLQSGVKHVKASSFDPTKYNGVKISFIPTPDDKTIKRFMRKGVEKYENELTISVFNSGNVIINGGNTSFDTVSAYNWINKYLDDNYSDLVRNYDKDFKPKKKIHRIYHRTEIINDLVSELKEICFINHRNKFKEVLLSIERLRIDGCH